MLSANDYSDFFRYLIAPAIIILILWFMLLTGEIIEWILTGGDHKISISNALRFGFDDRAIGFTGLDLFLLFFRAPFLTGTIFWGFVLLFLYRYVL